MKVETWGDGQGGGMERKEGALWTCTTRMMRWRTAAARTGGCDDEEGTESDKFEGHLAALQKRNPILPKTPRTLII